MIFRRLPNFKRCIFNHSIHFQAIHLGLFIKLSEWQEIRPHRYSVIQSICFADYESSKSISQKSTAVDLSLIIFGINLIENTFESDGFDNKVENLLHRLLIKFWTEFFVDVRRNFSFIPLLNPLGIKLLIFLRDTSSVTKNEFSKKGTIITNLSPNVQ